MLKYKVAKLKFNNKYNIYMIVSPNSKLYK